MDRLVRHFDEQMDRMLDLLHEMVSIESPSHDKAAVDRMGSRVAALMRSARGKVETFPQERFGDLVLGSWEGGPAERPILLLCHMDTVWPVGTLETRPTRVEDCCYYGPGACDMKGGIVIALTALDHLNALGLKPVAPVRILCTGDEEVGSPDSRVLIEELAAESGLVLCMEPTLPGGALKTARKGGGPYTIRVRGRAAHAGAAHEQGINAIEEMARQVLALQALTDYERGTTVSVGLINGGSGVNIVPPECEIKVDFRVTVMSEAERMKPIFEGLKPHMPGTEVTVEGGLNRPPMVRDALMARTFEQVQRIGRRHGLEIREGSSGGGSDGNLTAALGVPTIDGLGVDGDGLHAIHEHIQIPSLPRQAALLAALLTEWEF